MPWPFAARPFHRRYDRQRTPDGGGARHGSGARFDPGSTAVGATAATREGSRNRSRERAAAYAERQQPANPLRQVQQDRQAAQLYERVVALEVSVVKLK